MFPNLLEATRQYWRKLDELELAYQQGEVSLEEVNGRVKELMAELGQERRAAMQFFFGSLSRFWAEQKEVAIGLGLIGMLTYTWIVMS
jgi:hypothetical protein